jgi:hypothetical protein
LELDGRKWAVSHPSSITAGKIVPNWIRGYRGPRASLDIVENRKICLCRGHNPGHPVHIVHQRVEYNIKNLSVRYVN